MACNTLLNVFQEEKEKLREYMSRFAVAIQGVDNPKDFAVMMALINGMKSSQSAASLIRHPMKTLSEAMTQVQEEMHFKDMLAGKFKMTV